MFEFPGSKDRSNIWLDSINGQNYQHDFHLCWDFERNDVQNPLSLTKYDDTIYWFKCEFNHRHPYQTSLRNFNYGERCPTCKGVIQYGTSREEWACIEFFQLLWKEKAQYHLNENGQFTVEGVGKVDGFFPSIEGIYPFRDPREKQLKGLIIEYHGCHYHGCRFCYRNRNQINSKCEKSVENCYRETIKRDTEIINSRYKLISVWSCQFNKLLSIFKNSYRNLLNGFDPDTTELAKLIQYIKKFCFSIKDDCVIPEIVTDDENEESESEDDDEYESLPDELDKPIEPTHFKQPVGSTQIMSMDQVQATCTNIHLEVKENKKKAELQRFNVVGSFMTNSIKPVTIPAVKFHQEQIPSSITSRNMVVGGAPSDVPDPLTLASVSYPVTVVSKKTSGAPPGIPGSSVLDETDHRKSNILIPSSFSGVPSKILRLSFYGSSVPSGLSSYDPLTWNE